jgi:eukaryotic-like serine/threonine-protein kinase
LQVDLRTRAETFDNFSIDAQYAEVSGLADPAVQERVNAALRAPVDEWVDFLQERTSVAAEPGVAPAEGTVEPRVRISGPKVISVDHVRVAGDASAFYFGVSGEASSRPVTIDLATGQVLQLADIFPGVNTDDGTATLAERIVAEHPEGICGEGGAPADAEPLSLTPESFTEPYSNGGDPLVQVVFTRDSAEFVIHPSGFGYPNVCDFTASPVPYAELTDLMSPRAVELMTR